MGKIYSWRDDALGAEFLPPGRAGAEVTILPLVLALGFVAFCAFAAIRVGGRRGPTTEEIVRRAREWRIGHVADPPQKEKE